MPFYFLYTDCFGNFGKGILENMTTTQQAWALKLAQGCWQGMAYRKALGDTVIIVMMADPVGSDPKTYSAKRLV